MTSFADRLIELRKNKGLHQKDVAKSVGISIATYQRYEYAERLPNLKIIIALANFFSVSTDYLLCLSDNPQRQANISNSTIVQHNNLKQSNINIKNEQNLNPQAKELINIFENLDLRNQTKLLSYAFELENKEWFLKGSAIMPEITRFYGIIIKMLFNDTAQHNKPHIHAYYGEYEASISIDGELLAGSMPYKQLKIIIGWLALHEIELYSAWNKAIKGESINKIKPLQ